MKQTENQSDANGTVLMNDDSTVPMPDADGTVLMDDDTAAGREEDHATALMEDDGGTVLMDEDVSADNGSGTALMDDDTSPQMPDDANVRRQPQTDVNSTGRGGGYIPDEVCGDDLTDVRPLNASGGFSNLFRAHKTGLDIDVVIKRVKKQYAGRMDEQSEARIMTALRHQYLPRIYDLKIADDGFTYTVMEHIDGPTLREYVKKHGALNQKLVYKWLKQLCEVVAYMHARKPAIIHSDLKPENIMITSGDDICVIDFNASLEVRDDSQDIEAIGATPGYAAPEQYCLPLARFSETNPLYPYVKAAQGMGSITPRTDIYAIGALAYYMITGCDPKPWKDGIVPLENYHISIGYSLSTIIEKAMQPKPSDRIKSAAAMLASLGNLKKSDKRYKRMVLKSRIASVIITLGLAASVFCTVEGLQQIKEEKTEAYLVTVSEAAALRENLRFEEAETLLIEALGMDGSRIEAYLELGSLLFTEGRYEEAIDLMEGLTFQSRPGDNAEAFLLEHARLNYVTGSCYYQLEDYPNALVSYQTAVTMCPTEPDFLRDLAICYARVGDMEAAGSTVASLADTDCSPLDLALVEGEIRFASGEYEAALDKLMDAAALSGDTALVSRSYILAAQCCQKLGAGWIAREIELLEEAVDRVGMENSIILQMLSEVYMRQYSAADGGDKSSLERALACVEQLVGRGYTTYTILQNRAVLLQYLERYDEAETVLKQLAEDYPNNYRVPMRLAMLIVDREGKKPSASRDYSVFGVYLEEARRLYKINNVQDSEMLRLEDIAAQLSEFGWDY
ncbi:MAG: tetratricopeptide repeat protein [Ruminococcaceae bacterium]|nr:tetratricopeptide repeat protein [Oscillospiraceae bacterium]